MLSGTGDCACSLASAGPMWAPPLVSAMLALRSSNRVTGNRLRILRLLCCVASFGAGWRRPSLMHRSGCTLKKKGAHSFPLVNDERPRCQARSVDLGMVMCMHTDFSPSTTSRATPKSGIHFGRLAGFRRFHRRFGLLGEVGLAQFSYSVQGRIVSLIVPDAGSAFRDHLTSLLGRAPLPEEIRAPETLLGWRCWVRIGHRAGVPVILDCQPP